MYQRSQIRRSTDQSLQYRVFQKHDSDGDEDEECGQEYECGTAIAEE